MKAGKPVRTRLVLLIGIVAALLAFMPSVALASPTLHFQAHIAAIAKPGQLGPDETVVLANGGGTRQNCNYPMIGSPQADYAYDLHVHKALARARPDSRLASPATTHLERCPPVQAFNDVRRPLAAEGEGSPASSAYHYTYSEYAASIEKIGLRAGTYATTSGNLSPLQAQLDLALPPNLGLPDAQIEIDLAGLREAGYAIPEETRVSNVVKAADGRVYSLPGGGYEMEFPYPIPPQFVKVVTP
jgi:hypothetical protein